MGVIMNFYNDAMCKNPILSPAVGVMGVTGTYNNLSAWQKANNANCYYRMFNRYTPGREGFTFGGGSSLFNFNFATSNFYTENVLKPDTKTNAVTTAFNNALFISANHERQNVQYSYYVQMIGTLSTGTCNYTVQVGEYTQNPYDGNRTTWQYQDNAGGVYARQSGSVSSVESSQFTSVKLFSCNIGETDFYCLAVGIGAGNEFAVSETNTLLFLIPRDYFKDAIPKPYVGPVSKDSAENFTPPTTPHKDSIYSRDLTGKKNPFGFGANSPVKLLKFSDANYQLLVKEIMLGSLDNIANSIGILNNTKAAGIGFRPADELQAMLSSVMCCYMLPEIAVTGGSSYSVKSVGGGELVSPVPAVLLSEQIIEHNSISAYIPPIDNSFIAYAPYTHITLTVPLIGDIQLEPSAVFGNYLQLKYKMDMLTGALSCDIIITESTGFTYVYATKQTTCAIEVPFIGNAQNQAAQMKQAAATLGIIGSIGTMAAGAVNPASLGAGALGLISSINNLNESARQAQIPQTVSRGTNPNLAPYLSPRSAYLTIEYPEPNNPKNYFDAVGGYANIGGILSEFAGYTEISSIDLSSCSGMTESEKQEVFAILSGGVYL